MPIEVLSYNPIWPIQFEHIVGTIRPAVAHIPAAQIEHVGSTSVPGLAAKPIIDIDAIVNREDIPAGIAALASIGYVHRGISSPLRVLRTSCVEHGTNGFLPAACCRLRANPSS